MKPVVATNRDAPGAQATWAFLTVLEESSMEQVSLSAKKRDAGGKGVARKLRAAGQIPGVAYGLGTDPVPVVLEERDLVSVAKHGANVLIDLSIDGAKTPEDTLAILKELQRDPTTDQLLNADLQWISLTAKITLEVPVALEGLATGVEAGGILEQSLWTLQVSVLPTAIPQSIPVSVAELDIGQSLHVRDLVVPEGVEVLSPADEPVASVNAPKVEEEVVEELEEGVLVEGKEGEPVEGEEGAEEQEGSEPEADDKE
jgi:large subunit ribosomal protein L25